MFVPCCDAFSSSKSLLSLVWLLLCARYRSLIIIDISLISIFEEFRKVLKWELNVHHVYYNSVNIWIQWKFYNGITLSIQMRWKYDHNNVIISPVGCGEILVWKGFWNFQLIIISCVAWWYTYRLNDIICEVITTHNFVNWYHHGFIYAPTAEDVVWRYFGTRMRFVCGLQFNVAVAYSLRLGTVVTFMLFICIFTRAGLQNVTRVGVEYRTILAANVPRIIMVKSKRAHVVSNSLFNSPWWAKR